MSCAFGLSTTLGASYTENYWIFFLLYAFGMGIAIGLTVRFLKMIKVK